MSEIRITRDYLYPVARVWRAVTDPGLVPRWTATGAGGRPEGFAPVPGTKFRFLARPKLGWNGIVNCVVIEAREPVLLRYSWTDDGGGGTTEVAYRLEPSGDGTRFTYEHTGFTGAGFSWPGCSAGSVARCWTPDCRPSWPTSSKARDVRRLRAEVLPRAGASREPRARRSGSGRGSGRRDR